MAILFMTISDYLIKPKEVENENQRDDNFCSYFQQFVYSIKDYLYQTLLYKHKNVFVNE